MIIIKSKMDSNNTKVYSKKNIKKNTKTYTKKNSLIKKRTKKHPGHLFTDDNPESTVPNTGFANKEIVLKTLKDMEHRDIVYQFQVINTMYHRGLSVVKQTKDEGKKQDITEGLSLYKKWLSDYKSRDRKKEMMPYLSLDVVNELEALAEYYDISRKARGLDTSTKSDKGFLQVYREVEGNEKMLRTIPIKSSVPDGITWDKYRNQYLTRRKSMIKIGGYGMYHTSGELKGLPTKLHVNMIMWGYSPDKKKISSKSYLMKVKKVVG